MGHIYYLIVLYLIYFIFAALFIFNIIRYIIRIKKPLKAGDEVFILTGKDSTPKYVMYTMIIISIALFLLAVVMSRSIDDLIRSFVWLLILLNISLSVDRHFVILENGLAVKSFNTILELYEWSQITEFKIYNNLHRDYEYILLIRYGKCQKKLKLKVDEEKRKALEEIIEKYYKVCSHNKNVTI